MKPSPFPVKRLKRRTIFKLDAVFINNIYANHKQTFKLGYFDYFSRNFE